ECRTYGTYFHKSLNEPLTPLMGPFPPNIQRLPAASIQFGAPPRAPGTVLELPTPKVPWFPASPSRFDPLCQVHQPVLGLYSHRSFSSPALPVESKPIPPKSQTLPLASIQLTDPFRDPGILAGSAIPWVP